MLFGLMFIKIFSMASIFGVIMVFGYLGHSQSQSQKSESQLINYSNCVSAGILISGVFLQILPDALATYDKTMAKMNPAGAASPVNWVLLTTVVSFLFMLGVEMAGPTEEEVAAGSALLEAEEADGQTASQGLAGPEDAQAEQDEEEQNLVGTTEKSAKTASRRSRAAAKGIINIVFIYSLCLSIHSVFEGSVIGFMSSGSQLLAFTVAIISHEWALAFTIGVECAKYKTGAISTFITIAMFALSHTVGGILGLILSNIGGLVTSLAYGFSAGALLYVGVMELLVEEFEDFDKETPWVKYALVFVGIGVTVAINQVEVLTTGAA